MQSELYKPELKACPNCGGTLERGYLIGKQNRIRWSASAKGITIFHGAPLIKHEKEHWREWQSWAYGPSIPSMRCPGCKLVIFSYNNDVQENPKKEYWASIIFGGVLIVPAIALEGIALWGWSPPLPVFMRIILGVFSFIIIMFGGMLLAHAFRYLKPNKANQHGSK